MALRNSLSLPFLSLLVVFDTTTSNYIICNLTAFSFPSLLGTTVESIEPQPVYNTSNLYWTPEALSVSGPDVLEFCNVTITYTRPGTNVIIHVQALFPRSVLDWNDRLIGVGVGGFAVGELDGDPSPLSYTTATPPPPPPTQAAITASSLEPLGA